MIACRQAVVLPLLTGSSLHALARFFSRHAPGRGSGCGAASSALLAQLMYSTETLHLADRRLI